VTPGLNTPKLDMTAFHILFETDRFNLSEVEDHFINPCCFGEDLAQWLREKLTEKGAIPGALGQEDWGWYLFVEQGSERYFVGVGGNPTEGAAARNEGEWRIMVERKRSLWDKLRGRNLITDADPIFAMIEDILREQADIRNISREFISR
jgi:hypothetical protein